MNPPAFSIVVPAYNEARRLPASLSKLASFCETLKEEPEVLIVVEKSLDATWEIAQEAAATTSCFRVLGGCEHRGKGFAVRKGVLEAKGEVIFFMDADLSVPLAEIPVFLNAFAKDPHLDVLVGSRKHRESQILKRQSRGRECMGEAFNWILRRTTGVTIRDTQCGFKAFRRRAAQAIFQAQTIEGFAFDVEILLLAERFGFEVRERPVQWVNSEDSRVNVIVDSIKMLRDALKVKHIVNNAPIPSDDSFRKG